MTPAHAEHLSLRNLRSSIVRARARLLPRYVRRRVFDDIYRAGGWRGESTTVSGTGSNLEQTDRLRSELPQLLAELGTRTLLDVPCGDFHWMSLLDLGSIDYLGLDIVAGLVDSDNERYGRHGRAFAVADMVSDRLPARDVVLCRDGLVHLTLHDALSALRNFKRSGSTYLITTTFPTATRNDDFDQAGGWRPLNLTLAPFALPEPLTLMNEGCTEELGGFRDKSLGLWRLAELPL